jgi:hypothetical protein
MPTGKRRVFKPVEMPLNAAKSRLTASAQILSIPVLGYIIPYPKRVIP